MAQFNRIRRTSIDKLTDVELEKIIWIRLTADFPEPAAIMQKVVRPSDFENYFNRRYKLRGFVTRAQRCKASQDT
jgi:hypothetical protein